MRQLNRIVRRALPPYPPHRGCELAHPLRGYAPIPNPRVLAQIGANWRGLENRVLEHIKGRRSEGGYCHEADR